VVDKNINLPSDFTRTFTIFFDRRDYLKKFSDLLQKLIERRLNFHLLAQLLIKAQLCLKEKIKDIKRPLKLLGQEVNSLTFAMAKMNAFIHDMVADIRVGDTIRNPRFVDGGKLKQFRIGRNSKVLVR